MTYIDLIGSSGVFLILLAYLLLILHKLTRDSYTYLIMNSLGAGLACFASVLLNYWPFIILEGVWTLASISAIVNLLVSSGVTEN